METSLVNQLSNQKFEAPFEIVEITHTVTSDACTVSIAAVIQDEPRLFTGSSRRAHGDRSNYEVGYLVALGRAVGALERAISRRANGLVKHQDDVAAAKRELNHRRQTVDPSIMAAFMGDAKLAQSRKVGKQVDANN